MKKLERLTQEEDGEFRIFPNGPLLNQSQVWHIGKIKTYITRECLGATLEIERMTPENSDFVPEGANSYVISDFNGMTQHLRPDLHGKGQINYAVYAVQFYRHSSD